MSDKYHQAIPYNKNEANKSIEKILSKTIKQNTNETIDFITCLKNMLSEANSPKIRLGKLSLVI